MTELLGVLLILYFGFQFSILFLGKKLSLLGGVSLGFPVGMGLFTYLLFILNTNFNFNLTLLNCFRLLVFLSVSLTALNYFFKNLTFTRFKLKAKFKKISTIDYLLIFFIVFVSFSVILINWYWPVRDWDALTLYDFRAQRILENLHIGPGLGPEYYFSYPLMTSLSHFWMYLIGFESPMIFYSLFFISYVIGFYSLLRKNVTITTSLLFTFICIVQTQFFRIALLSYPNFPYLFFLSFGVIFLFLGLRLKSANILVFSSILVALSSWTRNVEPFWLIMIVLAVLASIYIKKYFVSILYGFIIYGTREVWNLFVKSKYNLSIRGVGESVDALVKNVSWERWSEVIIFLWKTVISQNLILIIILGIITIAFVRTLEKNYATLLVLIFIWGSIALLFLGTYVLSFELQSWVEIGDSANRMFTFVSPLIIYSTALFLQKFLLESGLDVKSKTR